MTGNVAQVFLTEEAWLANLKAIHRALLPNGHLAFEVRDPADAAWVNWIPERTRQRIELPEIGTVHGWCEVIAVKKPLVHFRLNYFFESDGQTLTSDSILRFREKSEIIADLEQSGFELQEIQDAPDRPGKEFIFNCIRLNN